MREKKQKEMIVDGEVGVIKSHTLSRQVRTIERILLLP
jgi:hypothetical protein